MLKIDGISSHYGGVQALDEISLVQEEGEILALIGGNGAGKTTLLNLISGIIRPSRGKIVFKGEDISSFSPERIVELGIIQVPEGLEKGWLKCRILYGKEIELIEYEPHVRRQVFSLQVVHSKHINYAYKYADRSELEQLFAERGSCDDILIIRKGCVSDSSYANTAFWDGQAWYTPDTPLLEGTMRAFLLDQGQLREKRIFLEDLARYSRMRLINAMNDLSEGPEITMDRVIH